MALLKDLIEKQSINVLKEKCQKYRDENIALIQECIELRTQLSSHNEGTVQIGYHPESDKVSLSECLCCLSHAMEGIDMLSNPECPEWESLQDMIFEAFSFGEMLERLHFGKKEVKDEKAPKVDNSIGTGSCCYAHCS